MLGLFLTFNDGGGKVTLPAAWTFGSTTSRGPSALSPTGSSRSRRRPAVRPAPPPSPLPPLSAQRLRTLVPPYPAPGAVLQPALSASRTALATLACLSTLSSLGTRQGTTPGPEPALSCPCAEATCRRAIRRGPPNGATLRQRRAASGQRGPAPSRNPRIFCRPSLSSSRLLRLLRAVLSFAPAAFLFLRLLPGLTARPAA
jgi:hypothetical protein